ncbi:MAG: hypothetical protein CVU89_08685 [Firmicutes bacterium HGW-Firmicutes-14]|nr:MAG: hypothetical protein CVU89_08685 [Firmicutes bacterium HGW-Firmicutes-14]
MTNLPGGIISTIKKTYSKITKYLANGYDCYRCKKRVRGTTQESECALCGRMSCPDCLVRCKDCGRQICHDCHILCRNCCYIICADCSPKCAGCGKPICSACSLKCDRCKEPFCPTCIMTGSSRISYLCPGVVKHDILCEPCLTDRYSKLEEAIERESRVKVFSKNYKGKVYYSKPARRLSTSLFELREEALKALCVTTAFLNMELVFNVRYIRHRALHGNHIYYLWQATGIAAKKNGADARNGKSGKNGNRGG